MGPTDVLSAKVAFTYFVEGLKKRDMDLRCGAKHAI